MEKLGKTIKKAVTITLSSGDAEKINTYFESKEYISFAGFTRTAILEKIDKEINTTPQFKAELD